MAGKRDEGAWKVNASNRQKEYFNLLGSRPYDEIDKINLFCLTKKVGYALYGIPIEYPKRSNYYTGYNKEQIKNIDSICNKILSISDFDKIHFACTILILDDGNKNCETSVFRIGTQKGDIFIDVDARIYQNWQNYMNENKLPKCEYCFPVNGNYNSSEIGFTCSPASSTVSKIVDCADTAGTVIAVAGAGVFAASCAVTVGPAVLLAAGVSTACTGIYSSTRSIQTLFDRKQHGQPIGLSDSESRSAWITVASSALCAGSTAALGKAQSIVKSGKSLSKVATCGIHALTATSVAFSGYGFVDSLYKCVNKYKKGELTTKDVFDLSCEMLFLFNALHSAKATTELVHTMSKVSESVLTTNKKLTRTQKRNLRRRAAKRRAKGLSPIGSENLSNSNELKIIRSLYPILSKVAVHFDPRMQIIMYILEKIGYDIARWNAGDISLPTLLLCITPPIIELTNKFKDEIIETITKFKEILKNMKYCDILYEWFENCSKKDKSMFSNIVINIKDKIESTIREAENDIDNLNEKFENTDETVNCSTENSENCAIYSNNCNIEDENVDDDYVNPEVLCLLSKSTEFITKGICNDLEEYSYALNELTNSIVTEFKTKVNNYKHVLEAVRFACTTDNDVFNEINSDDTQYCLIEAFKALNEDFEFRVKLNKYITLLEEALTVSENLNVDLFNIMFNITSVDTRGKIFKCLGIDHSFRENVKHYLKYLEESQNSSSFDIDIFNKVLGIKGDVTQHFYNETINSINTDSNIYRPVEKKDRSKKSSLPIWSVITEGTFCYYGPQGAQLLSKKDLLCIVSQALDCNIDKDNYKWIEHNDIILIEVNHKSEINCENKVNSNTVLEIIVTQEVDEENTASGLIILLK